MVKFYNHKDPHDDSYSDKDNFPRPLLFSGIYFGLIEILIPEIIFRVEIYIKAVPFIALSKRISFGLVRVVLLVERFIRLFVEIRVFHAQIIDLSFVLVF